MDIGLHSTSYWTRTSGAASIHALPSRFRSHVRLDWSCVCVQSMVPTLCYKFRMPHFKIFMDNFLPNKVVVHLYLFRASMEHRIRGEGDGWNILSHQMVGTWNKGICKSLKSMRSHDNSAAVWAKHLYSDSVEDLATVACFWAHQAMGLLPIKRQ